MKRLFIALSFFIFSLVCAAPYTFSPNGDKLKVIIDQNNFTLNFFDSFIYWRDYSGTYNYDGYTDLSLAVATGTGIQAASANQKKWMFYVYLPKYDRSFASHELQSVQEQFINYLASLNDIIFFDLPGGRQSSAYPPDFWSYNYKDAYPLPSTGKCKHLNLGNGKWHLYFWKHKDESLSILLAISYEQTDEQKWFNATMKMIKKK